MLCCWWQQNQLPRRSSHTNSSNAGRKTTFQQCHINTQCTFHDNGHRKFLPDDFSQSPEYVKIKLSDIPEEIIVEYKLHDLANADGSVYIEANRGMYGLPQSGLIANELLEERLNKHGYRQSKMVPGLWKHDTRPIQFTLVVDDFGVKYTRKEDVEHLKAVIERDYTVTADWTGNRYIGITLDWDYKRRRVHLSMPDYVRKALQLFRHKIRQEQHAHIHAPQPKKEPKYNMQSRQQNCQQSTPKQRNLYNKFVVNFYS